MKGIRWLLLTMLLIGAAPVAGAGVPLWEGARTGMTPAEVRAAFPDAETHDPSAREKARSGDLGVERVRIPRTEIAGDPYRARFFFGPDGLGRVVLQRRGVEGMRFSRGLELAHEVRRALTDVYGEPVRRQTSGSGYLAEWRDDGKAVQLVVITQGLEVRSFQIVYQAAED